LIFSLLKGAEVLHIKKRLKKEWGGGKREFTIEEKDCFDNIEHRHHFFTSQERASIVLHLLRSVRANSTDTIGGLGFREGQSLGEQ